MKNSPIKTSDKWLPMLQGENPGEREEIWADQTLCDTKRQAEIHGIAMMMAYQAGRDYEIKRMKHYIEYNNGAFGPPLKLSKIN